VDALARRLYRHFDNGSFASGGRLFGGFWQNIPKLTRRGITIGGAPIVELDYAQLNPRLAYSEAKCTPPSGDAYTLPGFEDHREGVKQIFNALLFDKAPRTRFPEGVRASFPSSVKVRDVIGSIQQRHPGLVSVLATGIGHRLMYLESTIMMAVLRQLREGGVVALPVFDAVLVKASAATVAEAAMRQQFTAVTGIHAEVRLDSQLSDLSH